MNQRQPYKRRAAPDRECEHCFAYKSRHKSYCPKSAVKRREAASRAWFDAKVRDLAQRIPLARATKTRHDRLTWALSYLVSYATDEAYAAFYAAIDGPSACATCGAAAGDLLHRSNVHDVCPICLRYNEKHPPKKADLDLERERLTL